MEKRTLRSFSKQFKIYAVKMLLDEGRKVTDAARELDICENTLYNWKRKYLEDQEEAFPGLANVEFKTFITPNLESQIGFTIQKSVFESEQAWGDDETSVSKDFMRTPNQYGYATFIWSPASHFNANLSLNYTGSMLVPHFGLSQEDYDEAIANGKIQPGDVIIGERLEESKNFITADLQFSYNFDLTDNHQTELQIYAGVKNILNQFQDDFDRGVYRDAGYVYGPRQPRTINFGIKLSKL